ncbi:glycosyltransferase family 1 protein [uncultured Aquabacterium sp.]|jgi:alpha-1,6-mannosyltransferase|uniref:glycosyltransferase family 4 protein n=1 Tax=uncultured Aquabacterium sp. TaxID=158753 RepID=UPI002612C1D2|nr:glycosyltransferase family 1 protein [uncultured Aquabacterium sp.]
MPHLIDVTMFWSATGGGVRRYIHAKRAWLQAHTAWRHSVAAPGADGRDAVALPGVPLPGSGGYRAPLNRRAAARALVDRRPDLIESGDPYRLAWSALDAGQALGIPVVGFCHSDLPELLRRWTGRGGAAAGRLYLRHLYRQFDLVFAPSATVYAHLRDAGLQNVVQQGLGVDTGLFHPARRDPAWRQELGLADDVRVLLYAGRFAPEKNLSVLADAVRLLGPSHVLVAIGAGPCPPRGDQVRVLPFEPSQQALARALASADLFVHAGDQETFGLAALEAMACGCPVVVRDRAGLAELVGDEAGVRVARGRHADFAEAIAAALRRDREKQGLAARQQALRHDWSDAMRGLMGHYLRLMCTP